MARRGSAITVFSVISQLQAVAAARRVGQQRGDAVGQRRVDEVRGGEVDGDRQVDARRARQARALRERRVEDPAGQRRRSGRCARRAAMNSPGGSRPRSGCCQRTSASTPHDLAAARGRPWAGSAARARRRRCAGAARRAARAGRGEYGSRSGVVDARCRRARALGRRTSRRRRGAASVVTSSPCVGVDARCRCCALELDGDAAELERVARARVQIRVGDLGDAAAVRHVAASSTANSSPPRRARASLAAQRAAQPRGDLDAAARRRGRGRACR